MNRSATTPRLALLLLLVVSLGLMAVPAMSQGSDVSLSGNVTFTSDYVFRGISQANEDPAVQGGFDLEAGGFYIGTWGSNVDFGSDAHVEIDVYLGYTREYDSGFSWDVGALQYFYPGETELDTLEFYAGVGFKGFGLTVYSTDEYFGIDTDALYADLSYEVSLPSDFGLALHVGQSTFDDEMLIEDYIDYSVSLSKEVGGFEFAVGFYATDIDDVELADDRFAISISRSL